MAYPTAYTSTVTVPLPSEQTAQQIMGESYDPEKTLNVLKMFAGTEDLYEATIGIVKAMFQAKGIDPRTREMIILRAAKVLNTPYEAQANVQMAKNAGLSPVEIDAAASDGPVSGIDPEYVLVCKATDELSKSGTLRDETLRELLNRYGETISRDRCHPFKSRFNSLESKSPSARPWRSFRISRIAIPLRFLFP